MGYNSDSLSLLNSGHFVTGMIHPSLYVVNIITQFDKSPIAGLSIF